MYARIACLYIRAHCKMTFKEPDDMESTVCTGGFIDCFDIVGTGSHKYIPADRLTEQLGMVKGAGVYNYVKFSDGSYLLLTCKGPLAYWSGKGEDAPEWSSTNDRKELI